MPIVEYSVFAGIRNRVYLIGSTPGEYLPQLILYAKEILIFRTADKITYVAVV